MRHILVKTKAQADELEAQLDERRRLRRAREEVLAGHGLEGERRQADDLEGPDGRAVRQDRVRAEEERDLASRSRREFGFHIIQALSDVKAAKTTPLKDVKDVDQAAAAADGEERGDDDVGRRPEGRLRGQGRLRRSASRRRPTATGTHHRRADRRVVPLGDGARRAAGADEAPAPRLPLGPRADGAARSCRTRSRRRTRSRTRPRAGDAAKLLDELGDLLFQVYFLALLLEERRRRRPRGGRAERAREARAPASARLRRRRGERPPAACASAGSRSRPSRRGAPGSSTTCPPRCRRCSRRARCSGARSRPASTGPTSTGPLAKVREELARARSRGRPRRASRPPRPSRTRRSRTSSATSSSPPSTSRGA